MRVGSIATYCRNNTLGVFLFENDKDSIVLVTEPHIPVSLKSVMAGLAIYFMPKQSTSTNPGWQQLGSAWLYATGPSNCAHPVRRHHDVSEEAASWAHQVDIRCELKMGKIYTGHFSILYEKKSVVYDGKGFCANHLVVYQDNPRRPSVRGRHGANLLTTASN